MNESPREKWDARYGQLAAPCAPGLLWLDTCGVPMPVTGPALDVAAGHGIVALWMAVRGLSVVAVDISSVGLKLVDEGAQREFVTVDTREMDLEQEALPEGPFNFVTCFNYWQRDLFPQFATCVQPGGFLALEIATTTNLERNPHPSRVWLAEPGEVEQRVRDLQVFEICVSSEGWFSGRHVSRLVARRPKSQPLPG